MDKCKSCRPRPIPEKPTPPKTVEDVRGVGACCVLFGVVTAAIALCAAFGAIAARIFG